MLLLLSGLVSYFVCSQLYMYSLLLNILKIYSLIYSVILAGLKHSVVHLATKTFLAFSFVQHKIDGKQHC